MSDVSFLGLGLMGSAIAQQIQQGHHDLTVWNRSPEKMQAFIDNGAKGSFTVLEAVTASPIVIICIQNYSQTRQLFDTTEVTNNLQDRIIVQLSTGTPQDAENSEAWFTSHGAGYIDGAILGGPENLTTDYAQVIFAGSQSAYIEAESILKSTCKRVRYVGENIRAASALDLGWLSRLYGMFLGMTHGVAVCEAEGVDLETLSEAIPETEYAHSYVAKIHRKNFADTTATLKTWASAFQAFTRQAEDSGINNDMPKLMESWFDQALAAGLGEEDVTALIKILR